MKVATCNCGQQFTGTDTQQLSDRLWTHYGKHHRGEPIPAVVQLPTVDWHAQALQAVRTLAGTGQPFVISQVIELGVPDAPRPRTDWSRIQREAEALGLIEKTGRLGHSVRPTTKGSPVTEWQGTPAARRGAA